MLIKNVKIINWDQIIENADVEIKGSVIHSIKVMPGKASKILIPGFIDVHIHGFKNNDCMDSKEAVEQISKDLKQVGTTSFLPTIMTESIEKLETNLKDISAAKSLGANIIGTHMEGPFISHEKKGAHNEKYLLTPTKEVLEKLIKASNETLRKITIAPEIFDEDMLNILKKNNIQISLGHSNGKASDVVKASKYGATSATHLWNAMTGVTNRTPGIVEGVLLDDKIYAELICDLIHVDKEAIALSIKAKTTSKIVATTDALKASGMPDGDSISGGLEVTKKGQMITLKNTDVIAGSAATMHDNFRNLISLGYELNEVVAMTSTNAAKSLGINNIGEIKVGSQADLIIMDEKYNIEKVLVKGE